MQQRDTRKGILLMIATTAVFAAQDALSRHLAETYSVILVVMLRYWFFALFVTVIAGRRAGGVRAAARTNRPVLQIGRGVLLAGEICVMVFGFTLLGLTESHAVFALYPLLVVALSGPVLGERVGPVRLAAVAIGFAGILVILQPGAHVFSPAALVPLLAAAMFAFYGLLTRLAARDDTAETSFFWTGVSGAVFMTLVGLPSWEAMTLTDYGWMTILCVTGATGHWLLIKVYEAAEASAVQPFSYLQLVFASAIGVAVFGETVRPATAIGAAIIVGAGLFALLRERRKAART